MRAVARISQARGGFACGLLVLSVWIVGGAAFSIPRLVMRRPYSLPHILRVSLSLRRWLPYWDHLSDDVTANCLVEDLSTGSGAVPSGRGDPILDGP